ncbi:UDP-glucosyltransferase 2-like, partial [Anopheles nili]|uniref:UDP-glucosyltransferase 2-like n=1 Tax=Anopheles nili TaxID=185578 RepID=UPI00237B0CEB
MKNVLRCIRITIIALIALHVINGSSTNNNNNILYISTVASPSHFLWTEKLSKNLAKKGYNVTLLNIFKEGTEPNLYFLKLDDVYNELKIDDPIDFLTLHKMSPYELIASFAELEYTVCKLALTSVNLSHLISYPKNFTFDLILHDHLAGPCLLFLLERFNNPPLVLASASNIIPSSEYLVSSLFSPGPVLSHLYDSTLPMRFLEKNYNYFLRAYEYFSKKYYFNTKIDQLVACHFPNINSVSLLESTAVFVLVNSIAILEPYEPPRIWRFVNVGGLHINLPKPFDKNQFQITHQSSKKYEKYVYISFGSNVQILSFDNIISQSIIEVARSMPHVKFLWKIDFSAQPVNNDLPENIVTANWFPQNDLLGSGTVDVFVTHGGLLSVQEAVWYGIPMLGIPNYGDQYQNVQRIVWMGLGTKLLLEEITSNKLSEHLLELINNERYKHRLNLMSRFIRDEQITPQARAIWILEWVIRNHPQRIKLLDNPNKVEITSMHV